MKTKIEKRPVVFNSHGKNRGSIVSCKKSVCDNGWSMFVQMLTYKCERKGNELVKVDHWFPSSKTCCKCGHIHKDHMLAKNDELILLNDQDMGLFSLTKNGIFELSKGIIVNGKLKIISGPLMGKKSEIKKMTVISARHGSALTCLEKNG